MGIGVTRYMLTQLGHALNYVVSFAVFCYLDLLDGFLCVVYKILDHAIQYECRPCYCCSTSNDIVGTKLQLEGISDTLYSRRSFIKEIIKKAKSKHNAAFFTVTPPFLHMFHGHTKRKSLRTCRWSDCDCMTCNSWSSSSSAGSLYIHVESPKEGEAKEDVVFIHGFASSSAFWTETVFPNFKEETRMSYRLLAVDLLGFGKSPKPADSLYTLGEHVQMIEETLQRYKVASFHIVAHSLGSILAVALAARHPETVKSLTLVAPEYMFINLVIEDISGKYLKNTGEHNFTSLQVFGLLRAYFPAANGEERAQVIMRQLAPKRVWPLMVFGVSVACWYEHISRTICLLICKNHRLWETIVKLVTLNRIRTFLMQGFFCHTHNAAWHTLHNIICGSGNKMDIYLDVLNEKVSCDMTLLHGQNDTLIPVDCSYAIQSKVPRARVNIIGDKDHLGIVLGRQMAFAGELEEMWKNASRGRELDGS